MNQEGRDDIRCLVKYSPLADLCFLTFTDNILTRFVCEHV